MSERYYIKQYRAKYSNIVYHYNVRLCIHNYFHIPAYGPYMYRTGLDPLPLNEQPCLVWFGFSQVSTH